MAVQLSAKLTVSWGSDGAHTCMQPAVRPYLLFQVTGVRFRETQTGDWGFSSERVWVLGTYRR